MEKNTKRMKALYVKFLQSKKGEGKREAFFLNGRIVYEPEKEGEQNE